ncbi:hypothetical protein VTO42DRAFT_181 [Malbranchea cinnamomea]
MVKKTNAKAQDPRGPVMGRPSDAFQATLSFGIDRPGTYDFSVPREEFWRVVEAMLEQIKPGFDIDHLGLEALQEAAEEVVVRGLKMAGLFAEHAGRATIEEEDIACMRAMLVLMRSQAATVADLQRPEKK